MNNNRALRWVTIILAIVLIIGETIVLLKTNKYWPLSVDDYVAETCLIAIAILSKSPKYLPLLSVSWAFVLGNMYAMLFTRLDPVHGSGERIGLLILIVGIAAVMLIWPLKSWLRQANA